MSKDNLKLVTDSFVTKTTSKTEVTNKVMVRIGATIIGLATTGSVWLSLLQLS